MDIYGKHPNAKKWTEAVVTEHLEAIELDAMEGDSLFLGRTLIKRKLYRHVWSYWKRTFYDKDDIMEMILRIEGIFEAKLLEGALYKKISPWVAVLTLKNNYHWRENPNQYSKPVLHKRGE